MFHGWGGEQRVSLHIAGPGTQYGRDAAGDGQWVPGDHDSGKPSTPEGGVCAPWGPGWPGS